MRLRSALTVNGRQYRKGDHLPWYKIYPFFAAHMLAFGLSGFYMAYAADRPSLGFLYMHGGFAVFVYVIFYLVIFGVDRVKWMFINAALGLFGIYAQIDWILSRFGKDASDYSWKVHLIPFLYYVLYTFLLYHLVLEVTGANRDTGRKRLVEFGYVLVSILIYAWVYMAERG